MDNWAFPYSAIHYMVSISPVSRSWCPKRMMIMDCESLGMAAWEPSGGLVGCTGFRDLTYFIRILRLPTLGRVSENPQTWEHACSPEPSVCSEVPVSCRALAISQCSTVGWGLRTAFHSCWAFRGCPLCIVYYRGTHMAMWDSLCNIQRTPLCPFAVGFWRALD